MRLVLAHTIVNDRLKISWGFKKNVFNMEILCSGEILEYFQGDVQEKMCEIFIMHMCPHFIKQQNQIHHNFSLKVKFIDPTINSAHKNALKG